MKIALEHGFTTMRDLETEGAGYADVALRDAVNEGVIPGPRMHVVGPGLSTTGSYPILHFRPDWKFPTGVMVCDGADACRKAVREQLSYGTDWVKVYSNTGGLRLTADGYIDSPPNWTKDEIEAVVSEAHAHGVKVAAHATSDTGTRVAVAAGVDSIEHGDSIRPEVAQEMARKGIFLSPTLTVSEYVAAPRAKEGRGIWAEMPKILEKSFNNCRKAGVKIAFGTDAGGFPWTEINQAKEFEWEVRFGMTPIEAIRSATVVPAELLGQTGQIGTIEKGAYADLIAVPGDPLKDVSTLQHVDWVMKNGEVARALPASP
jgi:imidazolonepropionase-like amidohydrolase